MRKTYKLRELDCANCAAKMERNINKLPGVTSATVSFMTQRLSIECPDDTDLESLMEEIVRVIAKVEPDCEVVFK